MKREPNLKKEIEKKKRGKNKNREEQKYDNPLSYLETMLAATAFVMSETSHIR